MVVEGHPEGKDHTPVRAPAQTPMGGRGGRAAGRLWHLCSTVRVPRHNRAPWPAPGLTAGTTKGRCGASQPVNGLAAPRRHRTADQPERGTRLADPDDVLEPNSARGPIFRATGGR